MKNLILNCGLIVLLGGVMSCSQITPSFWKSGEGTKNKEQEQIDFKANLKNDSDSPCKKALDKALLVFNKDIPLVGSDLDTLVNLLAQYQSCEVVKRDDRIAEVLLKMLQRVQVLEAEVAELKAMSIAPNP